MNYKFAGKLILSGEIECLTGLHIGGTTTGIEIGGDENPVIKDPLSDEPYIPGSALKGKLRSLTEWSLGLIRKHPKHDTYSAYDCHEIKDDCPADPAGMKRWQNALRLGKLFGPASDETEVRLKAGPSRLTVRDAFLMEDSKKKMRDMLGKGFYTEVKTENAIDRVTAQANPRPIERVPRGSKFAFTFIIDVYDPGDKELFSDLFAAMRLLEQSSLGGSGSRGHGQVKFAEIQMIWRSLKYYRDGKPEQGVALPGKELEEVVKGFATIQWPF